MKSNIELLKYMLEDIRANTLKGISGLTKEQLFAEPVIGEYPIGAYLMHLGEADLGWLRTLTGEKQPEELRKRVYYDAWFDVPEKDYNPPKEPIEVEEYINAITESRKKLLNYIDTLSDSNLEETITVKRKTGERTYTKKWIIYHLIEHEAHTRGQMFLLIRMAGFKEKGANN
jgi:uncharacterized damage-inducible protein DinB